MKISVNTEKDKNIFKSGYPMIVPFLVTEYGDDLEIEVYSGVKRFCKRLVKKHGKDIFSDEVLSELNEELEKYANLHGYEGETHERLRWYYSFSMRSTENLDVSAILPSSVRIEEDIYEAIAVYTCMATRNTIGGPSVAQTTATIAKEREFLAQRM